MGFHALNMVRSERLAEIVTQQEAKDQGEVLAEICDMTSTAGYDNDGSIGPDLVDNGIGLGVAAMRYDQHAVIFYAFGDDLPDGFSRCYYQYGRDEQDAVARLLARLAEAEKVADDDDEAGYSVSKMLADDQGEYWNGAPRNKRWKPISERQFEDLCKS